MNDSLISFKTAKLARKKGFNWRPPGGKSPYYTKTGLHSFLTVREAKAEKDCILRATQSLLQKWLREKHNIFLESRQLPLSDTEWKVVDVSGKVLIPPKIYMYYNYKGIGLEEVLFETLKLI